MSKSNIEISVIIPSYNRPELLGKLLKKLREQKFKAFEVIVVDQSLAPFDINVYNKYLNIQYFHVDFKGAAKARNFGAAKSKASILAFTDDDCLPDSLWLQNALQQFESKNIVGLEGRVKPERFKFNIKKYRVVSNYGCEGQAFMTANLCVLKEYFNKIDGFDIRFDNPHFREDTDFGWRLSELGSVPFDDKTMVIHPSFKIGNNYNVSFERSHFFVNDALLLSKHPKRYVELLRLEGHYVANKNFWYYFLEGFNRHNVNFKYISNILNSFGIDFAHIPLDLILDKLNTN